MSSINAIIAYLLALSLSIYHQIYILGFAVCNWLSFILRSGDLPSLLMAFFYLEPSTKCWASSGSKIV